jgi:hypothetical protein
MKLTAIGLCRALLLSLLVLSVAPAEVQAADPGAEAMAQRARKFAARRYAGMVVSLPDSALAKGLRVCARETPSGILGYWRVPPRAADLIDGELRAYLRKSGLDKTLSFAFSLYVRQYAGLVRDGQRFVYVNAILVEKGSPMFEQAKKGFPASCSSISGSWGVQYDTNAKKFVGFTKN